MKQRIVEFWVGVLMLLAVLALLFLALEVSGLSFKNGLFGQRGYQVTAVFDNIGSLKVRAPVRIAGVQIGSVSRIELNTTTYQADVEMTVQPHVNDLPIDTSARITSAGLLGENYISLTPGYAHAVLKSGSHVQTTYSATSLQSLISTFMSGGKGHAKP